MRFRLRYLKPTLTFWLIFNRLYGFISIIFVANGWNYKKLITKSFMMKKILLAMISMAVFLIANAQGKEDKQKYNESFHDVGFRWKNLGCNAMKYL